MKRAIFILANALALCGAATSASAQTAPAASAPARTAPATTASAPFGCDARAPNVCYFRIFYAPRWDRIVILPAGMKDKVPGITIGRDHYCVTLGKNPAYRCARKVINDKYNS
jgi:hypothetical protein